MDKKERAHFLKRLEFLYGKEVASVSIDRLELLLNRYSDEIQAEERPLWNQEDVLLITYGDMIAHPGKSPLHVQYEFLKHHLADLISIVHLLPFFPYSSDDGFSVIDYLEVDPKLGTWEDVRRYNESFRVMYDFVLNHCSRESKWFKEFLAGISPARNYFVTANPDDDIRLVVRPRATPLLHKVNTREGERWVWCTFGPDQVDVNFKDPDLLFEYLEILLFYLKEGANVLRLDAVTYLWKELGTECVHLPQTHEVVKLLRDIVDFIKPDTIILTETNVPHQENISYFGQGDEAHMVYQFSLPPLLLHALLRSDSTHLQQWMASLPDLPANQTFLNFTASHDGIGVRPLQGIISDEEIESLAKEVQSKGGKVSYKTNSDGSQSPYELNITYFDALCLPERPESELSVQRFMCSQAIMLSMKGLPAVYFHSLFASRNWLVGFEQTQRARSLNRKKFTLDELNEVLEDQERVSYRAFNQFKTLLRIRKRISGMHPNAGQRVLETRPQVLAFDRLDEKKQVLLRCIFNVSDKHLEHPIDYSRARLHQPFVDLITGQHFDGSTAKVHLEPYQYMWLVPNGDA